MIYSNSIPVRGIFSTCKMLFAAVRMETFLPCANASSESGDRYILTNLVKCKVVPLPMRCLYAYDAPRPIQSDSYQGVTPCMQSTCQIHQPNRPVQSPQTQLSTKPSDSQMHLQAPEAPQAAWPIPNPQAAKYQSSLCHPMITTLMNLYSTT